MACCDGVPELVLVCLYISARIWQARWSGVLKNAVKRLPSLAALLLSVLHSSEILLAKHAAHSQHTLVRMARLQRPTSYHRDLCAHTSLYLSPALNLVVAPFYRDCLLFWRASCLHHRFLLVLQRFVVVFIPSTNSAHFQCQHFLTPSHQYKTNFSE
jgi:hypothetical protein